MLGFDAYTKSTFGTIIEQRMRLFLVKRAIINIVLTDFYKDIITNTTKEEVNNLFFEKFKTTLRDVGIYEEYAISSILLEEPDYDFLSNDPAETIKKSTDLLRTTFFKICNESIWLADPVAAAKAAKNQGNPSENIFNYLKSPSDQKAAGVELLHRREILPYAPQFMEHIGAKLNPGKRDWLGYPWHRPTPGADAYGTNISMHLSPYHAAMANASWQAVLDQAPISLMAGPFYLEFFWRLKPEMVEKLDPADSPSRYLYYSPSDVTFMKPYKTMGKTMSGSLFTDDPAAETIFRAPYSFWKSFDRGVRLMFNMTSVIEESKAADPTDAGTGNAETVDAHSLAGPNYPFRPSEFLPFYFGLPGAGLQQGDPSPPIPGKNQLFGAGKPFANLADVGYGTGVSPEYMYGAESRGGLLLPFLSDFDGTRNTNWPGSTGKSYNKNDPTGTAPKYGATIFYAAIKKLKTVSLGAAWKTTLKSFKSDMGNYFKATRPAGVVPAPYNFYNWAKASYPTAEIDWSYLEWSKSLISFEAPESMHLSTEQWTSLGVPNSRRDDYYLYFPIILSEFVDTTAPPRNAHDFQNDDDGLIDELFKTENIKLLNDGLADSLTTKTLIGFIKTNEDNIKTLEKNEDNDDIKTYGAFPESLAKIAAPPIKKIIDNLPPVLFNTKDAENGLDNMLWSLINFDEEK